MDQGPFVVGNLLKTGTPTSGTDQSTYDSGVPCTNAVLGTVGSGVTAVEYGVGNRRTTVLTIAKVDAFLVADDASLAHGHLIYTLPAGSVLVEGVSYSLGITLAEDTDATPDVGIGTVVGTAAVATLDGTGTFENLVTGQTFADCAGTVAVNAVAGPTAGYAFPINTADAHTVFVNLAAAWSDTTGDDLTGDLAGTVTINWLKLS